MTNSRATSKMVLLDTHLATGTEATYTYTPSIPLDMATLYKAVIVYVSGVSTASFSLQMKINASTDYDWTQTLHDTTTTTTNVGTGASTLSLVASSLIDGANAFEAKATIALNRNSGKLYVTSLGSAFHEGNEHGAYSNETGATTITSIEILVSTSTWTANTEITIYGLRR